MQVGKVASIHRYPVKSMAGEALEAIDAFTAGLDGDRIVAIRDDGQREIRSGKQWPVLMTCGAQLSNGAIEITLPGGERFASSDPALARRLSELVGARISVCPLEPADNLDHYRRARAGVKLAGVIAHTKTGRKAIQRILKATGQDADLRSDFGREPGEPLPDLSDFPGDVFEFTSPPGTYFDAYPIHLLTTATLRAMAAKNPQATWDPQRFRPNFVVETEAGLEGLVENDWAGRTLRMGSVELTCTIAVPRCSMVMQKQGHLPKEPSVLRTIVREADQKLGLYASVRTPGRVRVGDVVELA